MQPENLKNEQLLLNQDNNTCINSKEFSLDSSLTMSKPKYSSYINSKEMSENKRNLISLFNEVGVINQTASMYSLHLVNDLEELI